MSEPLIQLDRSRAYGTCHGERTPDDPQYRVHYWQGGKLDGHLVQLPFDAQGDLVPDDGQTEPKPGFNSDGKPTTYQPLYTKLMRAFLAAKKAKATAAASSQAPAIEEEGGDDEAGGAPEDEVNLEAWLRGKVKYQVHLVRAAVSKRYHKKTQKLSEIVVDLVLDEKLVPEDQVCAELARYLPEKVAA